MSLVGRDAGRVKTVDPSHPCDVGVPDYVFQAPCPLQVGHFPISQIGVAAVDPHCVLEMLVETFAKTSPRLGRV
jgi:hypothetical protein